MQALRRRVAAVSAPAARLFTMHAALTLPRTPVQLPHPDRGACTVCCALEIVAAGRSVAARTLSSCTT